jgi:hypothetical protein
MGNSHPPNRLRPRRKAPVDPRPPRGRQPPGRQRLRRQRPRRQQPARLLQARRKPARQRPALSRPAVRRNQPHRNSRGTSGPLRPTTAVRKLRQHRHQPRVRRTPTQPSPQTGQIPGRSATLRREGPSRQPANDRETRPDPVQSTIQASPPSGPAPNRPTRTSPPAQPSLAAPTGPAPINRHPRGTSGPARPVRHRLRIAGGSLPQIPHRGRLAITRAVSRLPLRIAPEARHRTSNDRPVSSGAIHAATNGLGIPVRAPARVDGEGCLARLRLR